jgi:hypothetical protein
MRNDHACINVKKDSPLLNAEERALLRIILMRSPAMAAMGPLERQGGSLDGFHPRFSLDWE